MDAKLDEIWEKAQVVKQELCPKGRPVEMQEDVVC
jgi:hypothetical protein